MVGAWASLAGRFGVNCSAKEGLSINRGFSHLSYILFSVAKLYRKYKYYIHINWLRNYIEIIMKDTVIIIYARAFIRKPSERYY